MKVSSRSQAGFTILELLIVVVIIGILSTIVYINFNGVQQRAYNASVQTDIKGLAKKVLMYEAEYGRYPKGSNNTFEGGITYPITKDAYDSSTYSFYYCEGVFPPSSSKAGQPRFEITARSKSGEMFGYRSDEGSRVSSYVGCSGFGTVPPRTNVAGHHPVLGWYAWTNG